MQADDTTIYLDRLDYEMKAWLLLGTTGVVLVSDSDESMTFEEIMNGNANRQVRFRKTGDYTIDVQFWNRDNVSVTLNGTPINLIPSREEHAYQPQTIIRFTFTVTATAGDVLVFSREPIEKSVIPS